VGVERRVEGVRRGGGLRRTRDVAAPAFAALDPFRLRSDRRRLPSSEEEDASSPSESPTKSDGARFGSAAIKTRADLRRRVQTCGHTARRGAHSAVVVGSSHGAEPGLCNRRTQTDSESAHVSRALYCLRTRADRTLGFGLGLGGQCRLRSDIRRRDLADNPPLGRSRISRHSARLVGLAVGLGKGLQEPRLDLMRPK
jgi:hypothetical protein